MDRSEKEHNLHQRLLQLMADKFREQGYTDIRLDLPNKTRPDLIEGLKQNFTPDLTCTKPGHPPVHIILEVETPSTIFHIHTANQWPLFWDYASKTSGEFHIAVASLCEVDGKQRSGEQMVVQRLQELEIDPSSVTIWTPE